MGQRGTLTIGKLKAIFVHVLTASGAAFSLVALVLAVGGHWAVMFLILGAGLIVDGIDGPLARRFRVAETLPRWSGDTLDLVVDFTSYVFVPAYAIAASGLLPAVAALPAGIVIVITGAIYFADREMKTDDNHFRGFPAVWNVIVFYLFVLTPPPWAGAVTIAIFAVLTFVPVAFVHPLRVRRWRAPTIGLMAIWVVLAAIAVFSDLAPEPWVKIGLSVIAVYFLTIGIVARRAWI